MSAFVVDRNHVRYLVYAASQWGLGVLEQFNPTEDQDPADPYARETRMGQELWDENVRSVMHRYPSRTGESSNCSDKKLPGPIGEDFETFKYEPPNPVRNLINPLQVISSCRCLDYQSCEHEGWRSSLACRVLESIEAHAVEKIPGYRETKWGAPELGGHTHTDDSGTFPCPLGSACDMPTGGAV